VRSASRPSKIRAIRIPFHDQRSALVFYCSNMFCRKAPQAARRATAMGDRHVLVMSSGIKGWLDAALPVESGEPIAPSL